MAVATEMYDNDRDKSYVNSNGNGYSHSWWSYKSGEDYNMEEDIDDDYDGENNIDERKDNKKGSYR